MKYPVVELTILLAACAVGCRAEEAPPIVCTGELMGFVEPCGCTRPQLGGLSRRDRLISSMKPAPILLDNGDLTKRVGRQAHIKWQTTIAGMGLMGYRAVNVGEKDLALGAEFINREASGAGVPLISANIVGPDGEPLFRPFVVLKVGAFRLGVIGVFGTDYAGGLPADVVDPAEAVGRVATDMAQQCDRIVLMAHMPREQAERVVDGLDRLLFVLCAHDGDEPHVKRTSAGIFAFAGNKGKHVLRCRVVSSDDPPAIDSEGIALGPKLQDTDRIEQLIDFYQLVVKQERLLYKVPRASHDNGDFAGPQTCAECHEEEFNVWKESRHSHALRSLVERERNFDPECVVCHVTGLRNTGGFFSVEKTPDLANVGCEACHGPCKKHNEEPTAATPIEPKERTCERCHDPDNDPKFDFKIRWPKIKH